MSGIIQSLQLSTYGLVERYLGELSESIHNQGNLWYLRIRLQCLSESHCSSPFPSMEFYQEVDQS